MDENEVFKSCGHSRNDTNIYHMYGTVRCLQCKRDASRRYMRRKRREYVEKHGSATALPEDAA